MFQSHPCCIPLDSFISALASSTTDLRTQRPIFLPEPSNFLFSVPSRFVPRSFQQFLPDLGPRIPSFPAAFDHKWIRLFIFKVLKTHKFLLKKIELSTNVARIRNRLLKEIIKLVRRTKAHGLLTRLVNSNKNMKLKSETDRFRLGRASVSWSVTE